MCECQFTKVAIFTSVSMKTTKIMSQVFVGIRPERRHSAFITTILPRFIRLCHKQSREVRDISMLFFFRCAPDTMSQNGVENR